MWRSVGAVVLLALVATACGGGDGGGGTDPVLGIISPGVDVADEPASADGAEFRTGEDGEALVVADVVRTDTAGFAEVTWADLAVTRVDTDSVFVVTEVATGADGPQVTARLDVGRVWNRLDADAVDGFEVETDVATAAVRGTAFTVDCQGQCTFAALEGTIVVTTIAGIVVELRPGEAVTVDTDGEVSPIQAAPQDAWVSENLQRDTEAGFAEVATVTASDATDDPAVLTFEQVDGGTPTTGQEVTDQYQEDFGVTFALESGGGPRLVGIGEPQEAFQSSAGIDTPTSPGGGAWFLTDDGVNVAEAEPPALVLTLDPPTSYVAGDLYDIDGGESFEITAFDADGNTLATRTIATGDPGAGDGAASRWVLRSEGDDIVQVVIRGFRPSGQFGFGYDNFRTTAP